MTPSIFDLLVIRLFAFHIINVPIYVCEQTDRGYFEFF